MKKNECRKPENLIKYFCDNKKNYGDIVAYYLYNQKYNTKNK